MSACQKLMLVPEDMVKMEDVSLVNKALYYDGVQRFSWKMFYCKFPEQINLNSGSIEWRNSLC